MLLRILLGVAVLIIAILAYYLVQLRRAFDDIKEQIPERVNGDTNTPITLSTSDKKARDAAECINKELRILNEERMKYRTGNRDIDNAVANISHDLRTPLTAMNSYIDLLMEETDETTKMEYLKRLKNRTEVMTGLTNELFNYSVAASENDIKGNIISTDEKCNIKAVLEDCILSFYNSFVDKGITPDINIPDENVLVCIDTKIAYRILENIIGNGLKYAKNSFEILLTTDGSIRFSNYAPELTQVDVAQLFDRFYTVKNSTASTGLGLSIAKDLVRSYGGDVTADLSQDKTFSIFIKFKS